MFVLISNIASDVWKTPVDLLEYAKSQSILGFCKNLHSIFGQSISKIYQNIFLHNFL